MTATPIKPLPNKPDVAERRLIVLDHTGRSAAAVCEAILAESAKERSATPDGARKYPPYRCTSEPADEGAIAAQRLALSERIRHLGLYIAGSSAIFRKRSQREIGRIVQVSRIAENSLTREIIWHHVVGAGLNLGLDHLIQHRMTSPIPFALEGQQVLDVDPAMGSHHVMRDLAPIQEVH